MKRELIILGCQQCKYFPDLLFLVALPVGTIDVICTCSAFVHIACAKYADCSSPELVNASKPSAARYAFEWQFARSRDRPIAEAGVSR